MWQPRSPGLRTAVVIGAMLGLVGVVAWYAAGRKVEPVVDAEDLGPVLRPIAAAPQPDAGFVGSAVCRECHAAIAQQFQGHPMAHTMEPVVRDARLPNSHTLSSVEGQALVRPPGRRQYRIETTAAGMVHHELAVDRAGEPIYDQSMKVEFAIGSGRRGRSYLIDRDGWLGVSPVSWYSTEARWDLSPGYAPDEHPRFDRPANLRCLSCHSGRLNVDARNSEQLKSPPFLEIAIGCERCHGPGEAHVQHHRNPLAGRQSGGRAGVDPIVNPAALEPSLRESVCNQCHLQGEVEILRYGRAYQDFRPGQHLGEVWTTYVRGSGVVDNQQTVAISHVQQMRTSRCYEHSSGKLGCTSCHDPHSVPTQEERIRFFRQRCLSCHAEQGCGLTPAERQEQQNSCMACHMPQLDASDVPHTAQTDHRILRRPRQRSSVAIPSRNDGQLVIFDQQAYRLPESETLRARALLMAEDVELDPQQDAAQRAAQELRRILRAAPDDVPSLDALALMLAIQDRGAEAVKLWQTALNQSQDDDEILFSLATYFETRQEWQQAANAFEQLCELRPWEASIHGRYSLVLANPMHTTTAQELPSSTAL